MMDKKRKPLTAKNRTEGAEINSTQRKQFFEIVARKSKIYMFSFYITPRFTPTSNFPDLLMKN